MVDVRRESASVIHKVRLSRQALESLSELLEWQRDEINRLVSKLAKRPQNKGKAIRGEKDRRVISHGGYRAVYQIHSDEKRVDVLAITAPLASVVGDKLSVWELPKFKAMLEQPLGTPVELTREEAIAIAREAFGKRPDLPPGQEYVRRLRPIWRGLIKKRNG